MNNGKLFTKAVATMLGASLAFAGVPALAIAADGAGQGANQGASQTAEKTNYGGTVAAAIANANSVTLTGWDGYKTKKASGPAMSNPKVTVTSGTTTYADAVALGTDGAVALSAPVAVGEYTAVISSDNYNDVTVKFAYPALSEATIGGAAYQYLDAATALALVSDDAKAEALKGFAQIGETGVYYKVKAGSTALSGTLYGIDTTKTEKYSAFYKGLGATQADAADYDTISSATNFTSHHAGDISALVNIEGTDAKAITGVHTTATTVSDAKAYVEAYLLDKSGKTLTADQKALLNVRLNGNATVDPKTVADRVAVDDASASFTTGYTYFNQYTTNASKHYGDTKIVVRPKAGSGSAGFTWADYYGSLYAATIADANGNVIGMAPWIDLYAEGGHGAVEIAIKNGTNKYAANSATVNRFAKMYDAKTGRLKAGTYTVKLYAAGYNTLEYTFTAPGVGVTSDYKSVELAGVDTAKLTNPTVTVKRRLTVDSAEGEEEKVFAQGVAPVDGKVALSEEAIDGDYEVIVADNADPAKPVTTSYTFTLDKKAYAAADKPAASAAKKQAIKVKSPKKATVTYKAKDLKKKKKTFAIKASAETKLSYSVTGKVKKAGVSVSSKGKVTVKKGTKKGTYKVTVKAAKSSEFKAASTTVTVKVK